MTASIVYDADRIRLTDYLSPFLTENVNRTMQIKLFILISLLFFSIAISKDLENSVNSIDKQLAISTGSVNEEEHQNLKKLKISRIVIDGNKRTKDKWILAKTNFKEGEIYDSLKILEAEQNLKDSRLFTLVKIYPIKYADHVTILITVRERRYFKITDYSGAMYSKKWGQPSKTFLQAYGAFKLENFRGMEEELKLSLSFWTIRYLHLSWYKPFIKNPYFIQIGSTVGARPSIVSPWNLDFYNISYGVVGRRFSSHSKLSFQLDGRYKKYSWKGGAGVLKKNGDYISSSEYKLNNYPMIVDSTWIDYEIDTSGDTTSRYEWIGNNSEKIEFYQKPFTESFIHLKWITDMRNNSYNSHEGFYTGFQLSSNILYPFIDSTDEELDTRREATYLRLSSDLRMYHRGIIKHHTFAYRLQPTFTLAGKGNRYSGMYMGDIGNLRGYGSGYYGGYQYNNRLLFSLEYRFKLFNMPDLKFPFLAWYDKGMANLSTRFDGALIFDYGRIWSEISNPIHDTIEPKQAMGVGLGIRVISPNVRRSLCFDVVWGLPAADQSKKGKPAWYLYIDLPY